MKSIALTLICASSALLIGCSDKQLPEIPQLYRGVWVDSWEIGSAVRLTITDRSIAVLRDTGEELICRSKKISERRNDGIVVACEESMAQEKVLRLNKLYKFNVRLDDIDWRIGLYDADRFGFRATERFEPFDDGRSLPLGGEWIRR